MIQTNQPTHIYIYIYIYIYVCVCVCVVSILAGIDNEGIFLGCATPSFCYFTFFVRRTLGSLFLGRGGGGGGGGDAAYYQKSVQVCLCVRERERSDTSIC